MFTGFEYIRLGLFVCFSVAQASWKGHLSNIIEFGFLNYEL